jgi:hypothetical protein
VRFTVYGEELAVCGVSVAAACSVSLYTVSHFLHVNLDRYCATTKLRLTHVLTEDGALGSGRLNSYDMSL